MKKNSILVVGPNYLCAISLNFIIHHHLYQQAAKIHSFSTVKDAIATLASPVFETSLKKAELDEKNVVRFDNPIEKQQLYQMHPKPRTICIHKHILHM